MLLDRAMKDAGVASPGTRLRVLGFLMHTSLSEEDLEHRERRWMADNMDEAPRGDRQWGRPAAPAFALLKLHSAFSPETPTSTHPRTQFSHLTCPEQAYPVSETKVDFR